MFGVSRFGISQFISQRIQETYGSAWQKRSLMDFWFIYGRCCNELYYVDHQLPSLHHDIIKNPINDTTFVYLMNGSIKTNGIYCKTNDSPCPILYQTVRDQFNANIKHIRPSYVMLKIQSACQLQRAIWRSWIWLDAQLNPARI